MATTINILSLLKSFSAHQKSGYIHYVEFADYMRRFAQKHIAEQPELSNYLSQSQENLHKELLTLGEEKKIYLVNSNGALKGVVVNSFYCDSCVARMNEALNTPTIPYPLITDLPKYVPTDIIDRRSASDFIAQLLDGAINLSGDVVYGLALPKDLPIVLVGGTVTGALLIEVALGKLCHMLKKDEYHDYFLKKLKN